MKHEEVTRKDIHRHYARDGPKPENAVTIKEDLYLGRGITQRFEW